MKKIIVKRLVYHSPASGETFYGGTEYDGRLDDYNILGSVHEIGKTQWVGDQLWAIRDTELIYRITVEEFVQFQKRWYELLWDQIKRI
jgi:hypothetical protein